MSENTTPLAAGAAGLITIEEDAPPLVRMIGRALREAARLGHAEKFFSRDRGTVAVRSHDTPQRAGIALEGGKVSVSSGAVAEPDATVVVDVGARYRPIGQPTGDAALAEELLNALTPPFPDWREAAQRFWNAARSVPGIPDVLVVVHEDEEGSTEARFGSGDTEFVVAGTSDVLAGFFTGADEFIPALSSGLRIQGTWAQLSVMSSASWKVRFDV
ncbi:hypothetical protein [Streptomyces litmocidini]|uniref:SCP2 domain-containing protein n=1 Tax=Streptomyces litmocidini TaxID=67318 RepID=A0ABW7UDD3_9ACTN